MTAEEAKIPCGCFAAWTGDDHWEITSSSFVCDHKQFDRVDGAAPRTNGNRFASTIGRVPSDEGGPGNEETYWLRQKLQASIVHLRDIEDYFRMSGTPRSMDRADRARSLYEQISEDFVNGKIGSLTMRQRAEAAETQAAALEANARVAVSWIDQARGYASWDNSSRGIALTEKLALARAALADLDTKETP